MALNHSVTFAQNSTTYSLRNHAITFTSDRSKITLDPLLTVRYVSTSNGTGIDNVRGARFEAEIDGNWEAGGELLERQSTLSPFASNFARDNDRLPGWGRFKNISSNNDPSTPLIVDVAKATGFITWKQSSGGFNARITNEAPSFGWALSPLLLNTHAAPYPTARFGWKESNLNFNLSASQWIGTTRGPVGSTTESLFNRTNALYVTGEYLGPKRALAILIGRAKEIEWVEDPNSEPLNIPSITTASISGFSTFEKIRITGEVATSTSSTKGVSWNVGAEFVEKTYKFGINYGRINSGLYGDVGISSWSNAGLPIGVQLGGGTETTVLYFDFNYGADKLSLNPTWIIHSEIGFLKSNNDAEIGPHILINNDLTWIRASCTRIVQKPWDLGIQLGFESSKYSVINPDISGGNMVTFGLVHGLSSNQGIDFLYEP